MAADRAALLHSLRIEREAPETPPGRAGTWRMRHTLVLVGVVTAAMLAALVWVRSDGGRTADGTSAGPTAERRRTASADAVPASSPHAAASIGRDATETANVTANVTTTGSALHASGNIVARRAATVSSKTTSRVREVLIEEGMAVSEGDVIARLDDAIERAQAELARARLAATQSVIDEFVLRAAQARLDLDRVQMLAERQLVGIAEVDARGLELATLDARLAHARHEATVAQRELALRDAQLADLVIRAPFDGVVVEKAAQPGEMISPVSAGGGFTRTGIGTIVDMRSLEVAVDVGESFIARVAVGLPVSIRLDAWPDDPFPGRVLAIIPAADRARATIRVRVGFDRLDPRLLPELGVRVEFAPLAALPPAAPATPIGDAR